MEKTVKSFEERIKELQTMIDESQKIVFFGGAGVSTESGIPDFRSKDGLYNQHDVQFDMYQPEYLLSHDCLMHEPKVFFEFYRQKMNCAGIKPNITHYKLAELEAEGEKTGKKITVVTQNIDGLHQLAGSKNVLEIHGTTHKNYCSKCGNPLGENAIFESEEAIPICPICGMGMIRPDVVLYGESLPYAFTEAYDAVHEADMVIVAGTSLTVYPAANLVTQYRGNKLVIVNRDETQADRYAQLVFHESMGEVFSKLR